MPIEVGDQVVVVGVLRDSDLGSISCDRESWRNETERARGRIGVVVKVHTNVLYEGGLIAIRFHSGAEMGFAGVELRKTATQELIDAHRDG